MDYLTGNDAICKVNFGSQHFSTREASGDTPEWNQVAWLLVRQEKHQEYSLMISIQDRDLTGKQTIGTAYFPLKKFFNANSNEIEQWLPLSSIRAKTDTTLASAGKESKDVVGEVKISGKLLSREEVERDFCENTLKWVHSLVESEEKKEDMTADDFRVMLLTIDPDLSENEMNELFADLDSNSDGKIDAQELSRLLKSSRFHFTGLTIKLLHLLHEINSADKESTDSVLTESLMDGVSSRKYIGNQLLIKERHSGLIVRENIPTYIRYALKLMFSNRVGRTFVSRKRSVKLLNRLSVRQGKKYDKPETKKDIAPFIALHQIDTSELEKPFTEYANFNEFFARKLGNIEKIRPLPEEKGLIVSPADCRMMVFRDLTAASELWVKGNKFTLDSLLGPQCAAIWSHTFRTGSFCIARLAPQDYHRWHFPTTATLGPTYPVDGALFTVNPIAINKNINVYTENKRHVCVLDSEECGAVLLIAVAATMVGSIHLAGQQGDKVNIGDEHGKFLFGGSTVLLLFQKDVIEYDSDLSLNSGKGDEADEPVETLVKVRERIGRVVKKGKSMAEVMSQ